MAKRDLHQEITDQIIEAIEAGTAPWQRDWTGTGAAIHRPRRANGERYKGINVLLLWIAAEKYGFEADQWITFKQAKQLGGNVKKGERGTGIVYYSTFERENDNGDTETIRFLKSYTVFNVQQCENLPCHLTPDMLDDIDTGARRDVDLDAFFAATGAKIEIDGTQPRYHFGRDVIYMPRVQQFNSAGSFYGTLAHELIHWTGHRSRLDRLKMGTNKEEYAFEELIAELGACYLSADIGADRGIDRSAAYIGSWLQALKNDKKYIFKAAAAAQKAVDFALDAAAKADDQAAA